MYPSTKERTQNVPFAQIRNHRRSLSESLLSHQFQQFNRALVSVFVAHESVRIIKLVGQFVCNAFDEPLVLLPTPSKRSCYQHALFSKTTREAITQRIEIVALHVSPPNRFTVHAISSLARVHSSLAGSNIGCDENRGYLSIDGGEIEKGCANIFAMNLDSTYPCMAHSYVRLSILPGTLTVTHMWRYGIFENCKQFFECNGQKVACNRFFVSVTMKPTAF